MTALEGFRIRKLLAYTQTGNKKKTTKPSVDFKVNGLDILDSISRRGDAAVCLTAHIGNFELMAAFFSVRGYPMTVIARKANSPVIQKLLSKIRTGYGLQMLWREDADTSRLLIRAIKDKRYICALIDQDIALENGFTPFFGLEAAHPISPVRIAVRFKKPVLFWNTFRKSCSEHHISVSQIHWEDKDNPEQYILSEYARLTELKIRENPGQWVWWHRRWRRRPGTDYEKEPHKLVSSKDYIEWMRQMGEEKLFSEHSPCS
jgi:KDO2-lipid IV(A) lauroyltransferase